MNLEPVNFTPTNQPGTIDGNTIWFRAGRGPTFLGKVGSIFHSIKELFKSIFSRPTSAHENPLTAAQVKLLRTPGRQLTGPATQTAFETIGINERSKVIESLYVSDRSRVTERTTAESIMASINGTLSFMNPAPNDPISIPIVLGNNGPIESRHIVTILIKDGQVEYYDPKGISSAERPLANGETLYKVLDLCRERFLGDDGKILEHTNTHQYDTYQCGVYSAHFLYQRLIQNVAPETFNQTNYDRTYIREFRHWLADQIEDTPVL